MHRWGLLCLLLLHVGTQVRVLADEAQQSMHEWRNTRVSPCCSWDGPSVCPLGWKASGCWVQWELHQGDPGKTELRGHAYFPCTTAVLVASQDDSDSIKEGDFSEIVVNEDFSCLVSLWFIWLSVWRVVRVVFLVAWVLVVFGHHFSVGFGS